MYINVKEGASECSFCINTYMYMCMYIVIISQLTQVRKEKNGNINFRPGIEPGTQRLGVQYTKHQAITQDKS